MTRLHRIVLHVSHIDRTAPMYAGLLGVSGERISPGVHYFDCGGTVLALFDQIEDGVGWPFDRGDGECPMHLYIAVPEISSLYQGALELGFDGIMAPFRDAIYGERSCCLRDPSGNDVWLVEEGTAFRGDGTFRPASG